MIDIMGFVNGIAYMDFRKATDRLCSGLAHEKLAKELGVSVATVRQARLRDDAKAHRGAPEDWERTVISLAEKRIVEYRDLIAELQTDKK